MHVFSSSGFVTSESNGREDRKTTWGGNGEADKTASPVYPGIFLCAKHRDEMSYEPVPCSLLPYGFLRLDFFPSESTNNSSLLEIMTTSSTSFSIPLPFVSLSQIVELWDSQVTCFKRSAAYDPVVTVYVNRNSADLETAH